MELFRSRALVSYTVALLAGVVAARYLAPPVFLYPVGAGALLFLAYRFIRKSSGLVPMIALIAAMAGFMRAYPALYPHYPYSNDTAKVCITGTVAENPVLTDWGYTVKLTDAALDSGEPLTMGVSLSLDWADGDGLVPGDVVSAAGKLKIPQEDVRLMYLSRGVGYRMNSSKITVTPGQNKGLRFWPQYAAAWLGDTIDQLFPDTAGTVQGILLGDTEAMEESVLSQFRNVGIGHLLAVSGLHVGFIAGLLLFLCRLLHLKGRGEFLLTALCLWGYCLVTGMPPSALRATIMATCLLLSRVLGEQYDLLTSLSLSALITVLLSPLSLFQVGFLMSYGAVLGIGALSDRLKKLFSRVPGFLRESMVISLSAQAGILPISVYTFRNWYLFGLVSNILAVPIAGVATTLAFIACLVAAFLPPLGKVIAFLSEGLIMVMEAIARFLSTCLPTTVVTDRLGILGVGALYAILFCVSPWFHTKGKRRCVWVIVFIGVLIASILLTGGKVWITGN